LSSSGAKAVSTMVRLSFQLNTDKGSRRSGAKAAPGQVDGIMGTAGTRPRPLRNQSLTTFSPRFVASDVDSGMTSNVSRYLRMQRDGLNWLGKLRRNRCVVVAFSSEGISWKVSSHFLQGLQWPAAFRVGRSGSPHR
jgi:hypothetical protein